VLGRPVIEHLVDLAESMGEGTIAIHARSEEHEHIAGLLANRPSKRYRLALGPPPENANILRSDCFYDRSRLKRAIRHGRATESAVIWRIDQPQNLAVASDEVLRRQTFQPIGRYWATRPATALARLLKPTRIRPNHVTILSASLMMISTTLVAFVPGLWLGQITPAVLMAIALVLDTADGHLARLQGTSSEFGRWLDAYLDELSEMALHAGIAWAAYIKTGNVLLLVTGMLYGMSKYVFAFGSHTGNALESSHSTAFSPVIKSHPTRRLVHIVGHADIRWHLWIVLAAVGRLDLALGFYTLYFMTRTLAGALRKAGSYAS
jgi:phosphatidylglycerophosphate synthase